MLKPAVERHLARRAGEPGEFYEAGGSSNCPNVTYDTLNFTMQQAGQTGECTALMSALNPH